MNFKRSSFTFQDNNARELDEIKEYPTNNKGVINSFIDNII